MEGEAPTLFTQDDTGNYVEYTPPEPPAFHETLPEDIRSSEYLAEVKDNAELARYYVDLKTNELRPPETPEGYEAELPEGINVNEDALKEFKQWAFENNITQGQFNKLIQREYSMSQKFQESLDKKYEASQAEAVKALKTEWGDQYEANVEKAKEAVNKLGGEDFKKFLDDSRLGDEPHMIRLFAKLGEKLSEDAFGNPGTGDNAPKDIERDEAGRPMLKYNM